MSVRILIADDHQIMRQGLRSLIEAHSGMEVVAEAENGRMAVQLAQEIKPDVVIMDISMPDLNGIEATRQMISFLPEVKVIALSMHSDKRFIYGMFEAGASAFLLKDCAFEELTLAINAAARGRCYVSPDVAGKVIDDYLRRAPLPRSAALVNLSAREREVLQLLAEGLPTKQIAFRLHVSVKTVETHRRRIMEKLGLHSIAELTKYAVREGLTSLEP
ncbi:MAG: response regulator transcription factor [Deltaproteobacteria bacterium]|nr:response regulator transcription factor [Deltaproteobacteria bacterium]MBW2071926.1 response regulator transcription factor [Deltaproteobacteria bacterium]